jgi:CheY-like chemotaxis protein
MASPLSPADSTGSPPIVLLVEDDQDTAEMYATHLNGSGYWVTTAPNGEEGCRAFDELKPHIVVTDLGMPGRSDGVQLIEYVAQRGLGRVPVILVTGHDRRSIPHAAAAHVAAILVKPVLPDLLESEVRRTLDRAWQARRRPALAHQKVATMTIASNRPTGGIDIARGESEDAGRSECPQCGRELLHSRAMPDPKYDYFEPCPSGCGRFFRHRSTKRYYRLP